MIINYRILQKRKGRKWLTVSIINNPETARQMLLSDMESKFLFKMKGMKIKVDSKNGIVVYYNKKERAVFSATDVIF